MQKKKTIKEKRERERDSFQDSLTIQFKKLKKFINKNDDVENCFFFKGLTLGFKKKKKKERKKDSCKKKKKKNLGLKKKERDS